MTDDLLNRAARALREETEDSDSSERFTRARVMAGLQQSAGRRRLRLAFALPLAAGFAAATAYGTMKGHSSAIWHDVAEALGFSHSEEAPKAPPKPSKRVAPPPKPLESAASVETESAPEAPEPAENEVKPAPGAALVARPERPAAPVPEVAASSQEVPPAPPAPSAPEVNDPAHELYRAAHHAHFVEHDFAAALRAWDAYLAAAPSGRFAPEARYNRALCLVRLGRKDDAERALRPFADGAYGSYRRDEAKALIEALSR
jgi:TolA-binding protein